MAETIKVVRVHDGRVEEMYAIRGYNSYRLYRRLNKNGTEPARRRQDGNLNDAPDDMLHSRWGHYNQEREVRASAVRALIAELRLRVNLVEKELLALYAEKEA